MMNEPKISVIVPVYKAEAYLHRCVDSLLAQTFPDFEVILVDDGSPDRSGEICDEYARKDCRVKVIHQKNGGVSCARQRGLDEARSEYTIHADPDDWVEPDMLEELYKKAKEENADMVICDFYYNFANKQGKRVQKPSQLRHDVVQCELFQQLHGSCCNKLVRRACYNEYGVKFPKEISYCEDLLTNATLLAHDLKVAYLPKAFYHYDQYTNDNSIVRRYSQKRFEEDLRLVHLMEKALKGSAAEKIGRETSYYGVLAAAFGGHIFSSREYRERCNPYRKYCFVRNDSMSLYLYASCIGFYGPAYSLWRMKETTKNNIKQIIKTIMKKLFGIHIGGGKPAHAFSIEIATYTCRMSVLESNNPLTRMAA